MALKDNLYFITMKLNRIIVFVLVAIAPTLAMAWGKGHNLHVEWVLTYLPQEIQNFWNAEQKREMINHWAHYPDNQATPQLDISAEEAKVMADDYQWLKEGTSGGKRGRFHSAHGKGLMFFALAKAFRENRPDAAAIYAGTLLHSYADGGAFNHGSTMHYVFYTQYKHIKYHKLPHKDLWDIRGDKKILANAKVMIGNIKLNSKAKKLEDALVDVMMTGAVSATYLASVEADIGKVNADGSASKESTIAITKTLATQVADGVNLINDAWLIAKSKQPLDASMLDIAWEKKPLSERPITAEFKAKEKAYFKARDARNDNVYQGLWGNKKYPAIGFVAEAAYEMSMGELGFGSRFATAIIARGLKEKSKANVELFTFLDLEKKDIDVKKIPVLVLHSKNGAPARIKGAIEKYIKNGGKILYIGGADKGLTGLNMKKRSENETPVSWDAYIKRKKIEDITRGMKIELLGALGKVSKEKVLAFKDNPNMTGAWNLALAEYEIIADKNTTPLMNLILPNGEKYCVGAAKKEKGKYKFVYLPSYAFLPFMFSNDMSMPDCSRATTDSFGNALTAEAIKILLKK